MRVELSAPAWATHLLSDLTDWRRAPLPVGELAPFDLPDDVYFEYAWRDEDGEPRPDPDNTNPRLNPWWPHACNLTGPVYEPDPYAVRARDSRARGRTLRLETDSALLGQKRRLLVYSPAGCADRKLPYVVFQDGKAYYGWGRVPRVMDLLLDEGGIAPAHLIFVPPVERTAEYAFNPLYRRFICDEVLPLVARRVPWSGDLALIYSVRDRDRTWQDEAAFEAYAEVSEELLSMHMPYRVQVQGHTGPDEPKGLALAAMHHHTPDTHSRLRRIFHSFNMRDINDLAHSIEAVAKQTDYAHELVQSLHRARKTQIIGVARFPDA